MPRAAKQATIVRQWELLQLLPSRGAGRSANELRKKLEARGFPVTKRTVERDLLTLREVFPLERNEVSPPFGWRWLPDQPISLQGMELSEAVSLGLLESVLSQLMPSSFLQALGERFNAAAKKLSALPGNQHAEWSELVRYLPPGLPFQPPKVPARILRTIQNSLLKKRQLRVDYTKASAERSRELVLHPLALIQKGVRGYLVALTADYPEPVLYAIHRFKSVEVIDQPARHPDGFSLDAFVREGGTQFGGGRRITLKATVSDDLATLLRETPFGNDQKIIRRGAINHLTISAIDSWQLHFWILSQGASITISEPKSLRRDIISKHKSALATYSK